MPGNLCYDFRPASPVKTVKALPDRERQLMALYYFADKNLEEAGAVMGLSKSWACRLHARAVELLRQQLADALE